jgi:hypothetical protein
MNVSLVAPLDRVQQGVTQVHGSGDADLARSSGRVFHTETFATKRKEVFKKQQRACTLRGFQTPGPRGLAVTVASRRSSSFILRLKPGEFHTRAALRRFLI